MGGLLLLALSFAALLRRRLTWPGLRPAHTRRQAGSPTLLADYLSLTKPKVVALLLATTVGAMYITDHGPPPLALVLWTMLGGYLAAGGAGAINCALDRDIDIHMGRTSRRPVPSGRLSAAHALTFGLGMCALGCAVLYVFANPLAAALALAGVVYYALLYTRWLKRSTAQNIVIGGGAGAMPPLVGWAAVAGSLDLAALLLFAIIFYWTPPHFWALALIKERDYARAGVPMLPVVAGAQETRRQIGLYSLLLVGLSLMLVPAGVMGALYLVIALASGLVFLRHAWRVWWAGGTGAIWGMYTYSLFYLAVLFAAMVADRTLR